MLKHVRFFVLLVVVAIILTGCSNDDDDSSIVTPNESNQTPISQPIVKQDFKDVILKGQLIVSNCEKFDRNINRRIVDKKNVHKTTSFSVPSTAESIIFSGEFSSDFPVTAFLRDEMGYTKFVAGLDEGITSDWVVNKVKSAQAKNISLEAGKKYILTFYFFNDECRGLLCLGEKEPFATVEGDFVVEYKN